MNGRAKKRIIVWLPAGAALFLSWSPAGAEVWRFGLDVRDFATGERQAVVAPGGDRYDAADLLLLRGKLDFQPDSAWHVEGHLMQTATVRTVAPTPTTTATGFSLVGGSGGGALYTVDAWQWTELDREKATLQLAIDRLNVAYDNAKFKVRLGRQPVTFGKTFFWNPIDWVAPFTPVTIDRSYKPGVDVARFDYWVTPMDSLSLLYAAGDGGDWERSALVFRGAAVVGTYDHELLAGKLQEDWRVGYGISTTARWLGGAALRGEVALFFPDNAVLAA